MSNKKKKEYIFRAMVKGNALVSVKANTEEEAIAALEEDNVKIGSSSIDYTVDNTSKGGYMDNLFGIYDLRTELKGEWLKDLKEKLGSKLRKAIHQVFEEGINPNINEHEFEFEGETYVFILGKKKDAVRKDGLLN